MTTESSSVDLAAELEREYPRVGNGCIVVKTVNGYGPYAYRVTKRKGKQTWKYLGRADKLGLVTKRVGNSENREDFTD